MKSSILFRQCAFPEAQRASDLSAFRYSRFSPHGSWHLRYPKRSSLDSCRPCATIGEPPSKYVIAQRTALSSLVK